MKGSKIQNMPPSLRDLPYVLICQTDGIACGSDLFFPKLSGQLEIAVLRKPYMSLCAMASVYDGQPPYIRAYPSPGIHNHSEWPGSHIPIRLPSTSILSNSKNRVTWGPPETKKGSAPRQDDKTLPQKGQTHNPVASNTECPAAGGGRNDAFGLACKALNWVSTKQSSSILGAKAHVLGSVNKMRTTIT